MELLAGLPANPRTGQSAAGTWQRDYLGPGNPDTSCTTSRMQAGEGLWEKAWGLSVSMKVAETDLVEKKGGLEEELG